jgi:hypothetical protein
MTKNHAMAFLADAGHNTELDEANENQSRVSFKYCGTWIRLYTYEEDPDFLHLCCSYNLPNGLRDELEVARTVARIQEGCKVAKVSADSESRYVVAAAEQFVPAGKGFERTFWRSVDLVVAVARDAYRAIDALVVIDAAERFTDQMESELQTKQETT